MTTDDPNHPITPTSAQLAAIADDEAHQFFTQAPKYRTKVRLADHILRAIKAALKLTEK